jgi:alkylated DNA repair protein (DNA oxidative demethylase)
MTLDLFHDTFTAGLPKDLLGPGTAILSGFALKREAALLGALLDIEKKSPFRHMVTPGGFRMSVVDDELRIARLGHGQERLPL